MVKIFDMIFSTLGRRYSHAHCNDSGINVLKEYYYRVHDFDELWFHAVNANLIFALLICSFDL